MIDNFVGEIILGGTIINANSDRIELSEILPWSYEFKKVQTKYYQKAKDYKLFPLEIITDVSYEFPENPAETFSGQFQKFEKEFINKRSSITRFLS
jgi:hypothetical protein